MSRDEPSQEDPLAGAGERHYLFLFPHPDDDVFVAGMMYRLLHAGATLTCAWLTSGAAGGDPGVREREIDAAMRVLGVAPSARILLRLPDMGLLGAARRGVALVAEVVARDRPSAVFVSAFEGGHVDHDIANFIATEAVRRTRRDTALFEYPTYNASGTARTNGLRVNAFPPRTEGVRYARLDADAWACKSAMIRAYPSQKDVIAIKRLRHRRASMLRRGEPYRRFSATRDHRLPPLPGMTSYGAWFNPCAGISPADVAAAVASATDHRLPDAPREDK